ncbi:hypothetical protein SAMN05216275_101162, partial [Streptosporangium canum]
MTTTAERAAPAEAPEREGEGGGRALEALLLAALAARQEEGEEDIVEHPLLLAALARRGEGGEEGSGIEHPLLLAML